MKLAEAMANRADGQKRLQQVKERLLRSAKVQEGDTPSENPPGTPGLRHPPGPILHQPIAALVNLQQPEIVQGVPHSSRVQAIGSTGLTKKLGSGDIGMC